MQRGTLVALILLGGLGGATLARQVPRRGVITHLHVYFPFLAKPGIYKEIVTIYSFYSKTAYHILCNT